MRGTFRIRWESEVRTSDPSPWTIVRVRTEKALTARNDWPQQQVEAALTLHLQAHTCLVLVVGLKLVSRQAGRRAAVRCCSSSDCKAPY
jgi:hypothetical protein